MPETTEEQKPGKSSTKVPQKPAQAHKPAGLGLGELGDLSSLLASPDAPQGGNGAPLELELAQIDEDPHQPRTQFDETSLAELADTIKARGVKTPISVRPHPEIEGRFIINHGARRYRASVLAGKTTIPGFVDADYNEADQVIENLQRDALTAREVADYIGRELANGRKKGEIAKAIGKSPAFVTQHATLLDLPDPIAKAFQNGRCKDVTLIYDLVGLYKKHSEGVSRWLADADQEITRGSVRLLKEWLESSGDSEGGELGEEDTADEGTVSVGGETEDGGEKEPKEEDPLKLKKAIVQVVHAKRPARLILNKRPSRDGVSWIKYEDNGEEAEAELAKVQLVAVLEG
jgi:ParB family chromosome partitioning protein